MSNCTCNTTFYLPHGVIYNNKKIYKILHPMHYTVRVQFRQAHIGEYISNGYTCSLKEGMLRYHFVCSK